MKRALLNNRVINTHRLISIFHAALLIATGFCLLILAKTAFSQSRDSRTISYQGVLQLTKPELSAGKSVDGYHIITASLFVDEAGKNIVWQDSYTAEIKSGVFNILLGSGPISLPAASIFSRELWIGIRVDNGDLLLPLTRLSSAPYALSVADNSITASKLATDYVSGISINGLQVSARGGVINFAGGSGINLGFDAPTNSVLVSSTSNSQNGKGATPFGFKSPMTTYGDLIYGDEIGDPLRLAGNKSTTKKFLNETGDGSEGSDPLWSTITANDVPNLQNLNGDLTVAKGGTGLTTLTSHAILIGNGTSSITSTLLTNGQLLIGSTGNNPSAASLTGTANQVTVTNGAGSITLSTPQDIGAASSPSFANLTLSGTATVHGISMAGATSPLALNGSNGLAGQLLKSGGASTPTWATLTANDVPNLEAHNGDLIVAKGGTGVTSLTSHGILIGQGSNAISSTVLTNGQLLIGSTGNNPQPTSLTGTANQVTITNGAGSIALSTPQDIAQSSSPTFTNLTLSGTATTHGLALAGSSSPVTLNGSNGTAGQVLTSNGSSTPTWASAVPSGTILSMSTSAALPGYTSLNYQVIAPNSGWSQSKNMNVTRYFAMSATVNGKLYVIGGNGDLGVLDTVEQYDPSTNSWTVKASMPTGRYSGACAVIGGKIYVVGGYAADGSYSAACEVYDPSANTWSAKTAMTTGRYLLGAAALNGKLYAVGGYNGNLNPSVLNNVEVYDTGTNTWSAKAALPVGRYAFGCTATATKLYAFGGAIDASMIDSTDSYNPTTNAWTQLASSPEQRYYNSCVVINSMIYDLAGLNSASSPATNSYFDPSTNTWHPVAQPIKSHTYGTPSVLNSKIYLSGAATDGVEQYDPTTEIDMFYFRKN